MAATQWTPKMVEQLRQGFLSGLEIKTMATEVGKTPCAVNKALSRFGIRRVGSLFRVKGKRPANVPKQPSKTGIDKWFRRFLNHEMEKWVDFSEVVKYLNEQNVKVLPLSSENVDLPERVFLVGTKRYSSLRLLFMANKSRAEQNLCAFFVNDLSW